MQSSSGALRRASAPRPMVEGGPLSPARLSTQSNRRSIRRRAYYDPRDPRVIAELRRRQEIQQLQEERRRQLLAAQQRQRMAAAAAAAAAASAEDDEGDDEDDEDSNPDNPQSRAVSDALAAAVQKCNTWRDLVSLAQRYGGALAEDARALTLAWRLFERSARSSPPRSRGEAEAAAALEEWLRARVLEAAEGARQRLAAEKSRKQQQQQQQQPQSSDNGNGRRQQQQQQAAAEAEEARRRQAALMAQQQQKQQQQQQQQQMEMRRRREQQEAAEDEERRRRAAALEAAEAQRRRAQQQRQAQEEEARRSALQRQRERALAMQQRQQQQQQQQQRAKQQPQPQPQPQQHQQQRRSAPQPPPALPPLLKTLGAKTHLPALKAAAKTLSSPKPSRATLSGCLVALEAAMDDERERAATARAKQAAAAAKPPGEDDPDAAAVAALRRLRSDFDNFRARAKREKDQEYGKAAQDACASLCFPLLDAWDAAASSLNAKTPGERRVVAEYAQLKEQLLRTLKDEWGVEPVAEARVGAVFDPETMEAIARDAVSSAAQDGCVSRVFRAGYRAVGGGGSDGDDSHQRLLRPAMVAVASDEV